MKKTLSLALLLSVLMLFTTACDNEPSDQVLSYSGTLLNKSANLEDGNDFTVSNSQATLTINLTKQLLSLTTPIKISEGKEVQLNLNEAQLTFDKTQGYYTFTAPSLPDGITQLKGRYDLISGVLYFECMAGTNHKVTSSSQLVYPSVAAIINDLSVSKSPYETTIGMRINGKAGKMTADLYMSNIKLAEGGNTVEIIIFEGLTLEPTATGYKITATDLTSTTDYHSLKDFSATSVDATGAISGSFLLNNKYQVTFTGKMFDSSALEM